MENGARLGPYCILGRLGAGGMGEVYRARDERLGREVAVKVLPAEFAADPDRLRRFQQEARAVGALNHPNILVVHDLGAHEGAPFLVTELLTGETLRERLRSGPLPPRKAVEVAAQIADGLAAAHGRGIVHRDLKPGNLFLTTDGVVKILDFGLAKPAAGEADRPAKPGAATADFGAGDQDVTRPGHLLGTPGYMAPEQIRGQPVDQRADLFTLGCVLHEMIAGRAPFARGTVPDTLSAILTADPPPLASAGTAGSTASGPAVPAAVARAVAHCLEKRPEDRFQSARDLAFELRAILADSDPSADTAGAEVAARSRRRRRLPAPLLLGLAGGALAVAVAGWLLRDRAPWRTTGVEPKRIVVTVLENQTGDASLDPLGRMASDWITQGLMRIEGLDVVPSTSVLFARPTSGPGAPGGDPLRQLARETGAGTVVSGAYYRQDRMLQFQVKVTDAVSRKLIMAFDPVAGPADAPMQAIDQLRQRIMGAMAVREQAAREYGATLEPPLYDAYREFIAGFELFLSDDAQALAHFRRAAELDSTFTAPPLYEAYILVNQEDYARADAVMRRLMSRREQLAPLARRWVDAAAAYGRHRYPDALQAMRGAKEIAPRDPLVNIWLGYMARACNLPGETVATVTEYGSRPWPGHRIGSLWSVQLGNALHMLGQHKRELAEARQVRDLSPDPLAIAVLEVDALAALGRLDEVDKVVAQSRAAAGTGTPPGDVMLEAAMELRAHGHREASLGYARQAAAWFRESVEKSPERRDLRLSLLYALRWSEEWDAAVALCRARLEEAPGDVVALGVLGAVAARRGDRAEAERCSAALGALRGPYLFGTAAYRRACIAAQLGDKAAAVDLLRRAFAEGVSFSMAHHRELDLEPLWDDPPFKELLRPRG